MSDTKHTMTPIRELGDTADILKWLDYRAVLPPEEYDEASLLRLLDDDSFAQAPSEGPLPWTPVHAWRALAQMHSLAVIEPVLRHSEGMDNIHAYADFDRVTAEIGEPAIDPLRAILSDPTRTDNSRILAATGLGAIGRTTTGEIRAKIISALLDQIRAHPGDGWIKSASASALMVMKEHGAGPEVLQLYKQGHIKGYVRESELVGFFGPLPE